MDGYQQGILLLSGCSDGSGRYVVRSVDRHFVDAVADLFPSAPYFQRGAAQRHCDYWVIKSYRFAPPKLTDVADWRGFCRALLELQGTIDLRPCKTRRGKPIRRLRLRVWGQPEVLSIFAGTIPARPKRMQSIITDTGATYALYYQSEREIYDIIDYLDGLPRCEKWWGRLSKMLAADSGF